MGLSSAPSTGRTIAVTIEIQGVDDPAEVYLATLEEVAGLLVEEQSLDGLLQHILELTAHAITSTAAVSVTMVDDEGGYLTAASSHPRADAVDRVQYEIGEGPCIDTLETGREHLILDLADEGRWPAFAEQARDQGFDGVVSLPLVTAGGSVVGALNVFVSRPSVLREEDVVLARRIAAPAAATLANARAYRRVARLADQLEYALGSRAVIEQAKGVLMARQGCSQDEAFDILRRGSQSSNRKLRDIAADVVAAASCPREEPAGGPDDRRGAAQGAQS
jgi:transcriptional regulator with GAF, ATPase, and Fis domain